MGHDSNRIGPVGGGGAYMPQRPQVEMFSPSSVPTGDPSRHAHGQQQHPDGPQSDPQKLAAQQAQKKLAAAHPQAHPEHTEALQHEVEKAQADPAVSALMQADPEMAHLCDEHPEILQTLHQNPALATALQHNQHLLAKVKENPGLLADLPPMQH